MKKNNTNPARVALLPAMTATTAARIARANARHTNPAPADVIHLYAISATNAPAAIAAGDTAAYLTLRAREQSAAIPLFRELAQQQTRDRRAMRAADIANEEHEHRANHDSHRDTAADYDSTADSLRDLDETAAEYAAERAAEERAAAANELDRAELLESRRAADTLSDRADLVQAAAAVFWQTGDFRAACRACGREVKNIAAPNALTATRTKLHPITAEQAAAEIAAHGEGARVVLNVRGNSTAYYTIERRTFKRPTEERPCGWYRVDHYHTAAPYVYYEQFESGANAPALACNGGINAIESQADADALTALFDRAALTERERLIVRAAADQTAARHAAAARAEYWQTHNHSKRTKEQEQAADNAARRARWCSAFERNGIDSTRTQQRIKAAIHAALTAATTAPAELSAEDKTERAARRMEREQRDSRRGHYNPATAPRADLLTAYSRAAAKLNNKPAARWLTADERAERDSRAALATAANAERVTAWEQTATAATAYPAAVGAFVQAMKNTPHRAPAYAAHNAKAAALVLFAAMPADEQAAAADYWQSKRTKARELKAAAKRDSGTHRLAPPWEVWNAWTDEERAAHLAWFESVRTR